MSVESKLQELGLVLPETPAPKGIYAPCVQTENLLYTAGHLPILPDGKLITGRLGDDLTVEQGYDAAKLAMLGILATVEAHLGGKGSLDRVQRVVKIFGIVQCTDDFTQQPAVLNGASELLVELFGTQKGRAARSAIGTNALPLGVAVEIEAIFQV